MMQHHFNRLHMDSSYDDHHVDHDQNDNSHEESDVIGSMRQDQSGGPGSHEPETRVEEEDDEMLEEKQQMPLTRKKPKTKSKRPGRPLKDFFEFGYDGDGVKFGVCKLCRESRDRATSVRIKMTNSNTSGIQKHLLAVHRTEYFEVNPLKLNQEPPLRYVKNDYGFQIGIENVTCIGPSDLDEAEGRTPNDFDEQMSSASTSTGRRASSDVRGASIMQRLRPRRRKMARLSDPEPPEVAPPTESFESFGAFVASELRSLESKDCQKKLKLVIQKCIIQAAEEDLIIKSRKNQSE